MKPQAKAFTTAICITIGVFVVAIVLAINKHEGFGALAVVAFLAIVVLGISFLDWSVKADQRERDNDPVNKRHKLEKEIALKRVELSHMEEDLQAIALEMSSPNPEVIHANETDSE